MSKPGVVSSFVIAVQPIRGGSAPGIGKGSVKLEDFYEAEVIVILDKILVPIIHVC